MRLQLLTIGLFAALITLIGCGSAKQTDNTAQELDDRTQLLASYQAVAGIYRGSLQPAEPGQMPYDVEVKLFIVEESVGANEKGEAKFRPALRAYYRRIDVSNDDSFNKALVVRLYRETGDLVMGTLAPGSTGAENGSFLSITGKVLSGRLQAEVSTQRGRLGSIDLERVER